MGASLGCPEASVDLSQLPGAFPGTVYDLPTGDHTPNRDRHESHIELATERKRATRTYERVTAHDNARMHLGDVIQIYCQHTSSSCPTASEETFSGSNTIQLREALDFKNMHRRFDGIGKALLDTCRWIFDSPHYLQWQDESLHSEHRGFLWIKGKPGAGKSTLMKCVVNHSLGTGENGAIAYFFFDASGNTLQRLSSIFCKESLMSFRKGLTICSTKCWIGAGRSRIHDSYLPFCGPCSHPRADKFHSTLEYEQQ